MVKFTSQPKYKQTMHLTNATDGAKVKDQIWAGEIKESNQDEIDYEGKDMTIGFRKS